MIQYTETQLRTYNALKVAAEKISSNNYAAAVKANKGKPPKKVSPSFEARELTDAMSKVLSGEMDCEYAMYLINQYDTMKQRFRS